MTVTVGASTMAIVHFASGVRFVAAAACPEALSVLVARYVRERCDDLLWPDAALRVHELLNQGLLPQAIALYFERTGERWDREQLECVSVEHGAYCMPTAERASDA